MGTRMNEREAKIYWQGYEQALRDMSTIRERERNNQSADVEENRPIHTVRGEPIPPEGLPYGTLHDMDCPACKDKPFMLTPRSESYWAS